MSKKAIAIICAICIIGAIGYGMSGKFGKTSLNEETVKKVTKTKDKELKEYSDDHIPLNDLKEIKLNVVNSDIDIKKSEDNKFYMSYKFEGKDGKDPLVYKTDGENSDKLIIKDKKIDDPNKSIQINKNGDVDEEKSKNKITIYIPEGKELEKTKLDIVSGRVNVEDLISKDLKLDLTCGDVEFSRCKLKNTDIDVTDGDIVSNENKFEGRAILDTSSGAVKAKFIKDDIKNMDISADTTSGLIKENLGGSVSEDEYSSSGAFVWKGKDVKYSLEICTVDGDINLDLVK